MENKHPLKSKTIWLGALTAILAAAQYATGALDGLLTGPQMSGLVAAVGVLTVVLRFFTSKAVAGKVPDAKDGVAK